ncbi:ABC transporter ATP-binding protein [Microcoleus sp. Pol7_A1]|uniref:ABC transporter ATP-binding protein n=1 Tax=Microcoleus sp. Pol7_A1 TaxID=2818893 RepID=UPI002FD50F03
MTTSSSPSIFPLLAPQKGKLILAVVLQVISTALGLIPFILVYSIALTLFNPPVDQGYIWKLAIASLVAIIARWSLFGVSSTLSHIAAFNILYNIRIKLSEKFGKLPLGYFNLHATGALKKVMNEDVEYIEYMISHGISEGIGLLTTLVFTTIYLLTVDWRMTLAALTGIPVVLLAHNLLLRRLLPLVQDYYAVQDRMNSAIIEYVQGIPVIKAFSQTAESFTKYKDSVWDYHKFDEDWSKKSLLSWVLIPLSVTINLLAMLPVGVWLLSNNSLSIPTFILFLLLGLGLSAPSIKLVESTSLYIQTQESVNRIYKILNEPELPETTETITPKDLTIEFRDVNFSYEDTEVLQGISFVIPQNSITALVGPSGSGKTTIAYLIGRFWDVNSGEVSIGGVNIKDLKIDELMSKIAIVFQKVVLFNDTIYENIRMGNPHASQEAVIAAAKAAQCHEFIQAKQEGYQTIVGEKGAKLSGGQQQRISIARAILKDAPIVILDEATAFIDAENEAQIQSAINSLIQDKTLLIVAHRLSTITEADQILVIDRGQVVGKGKHEELLNTSALYRQMWDTHVAAQGWTFEGKQLVGVDG